MMGYQIQNMRCYRSAEGGGYHKGSATPAPHQIPGNLDQSPTSWRTFSLNPNDVGKWRRMIFFIIYFFFWQIQSMKNHNSPASRLRVEPTAAFGEGTGLLNIYCWGRTGSQSSFCLALESASPPEAGALLCKNWRKTYKKKPLICRGRDKIVNILHAIF